jgi:purine-binding chemotaxis protein CheW
VTDEEILQARAAALARPATPAPSGDALDLLTFRLGREVWALDAGFVHGVAPMHALAPLPGSPPEIAGVTSWHGVLLPVVDVKGAPGTVLEGLDDRAWLVVVGTGTPRLALLVGAPRGMVRVRASEIVDDRQRQATVPLIKGITQDALVVLDPEALLDLMS